LTRPIIAPTRLGGGSGCVDRASRRTRETGAHGLLPGLPRPFARGGCGHPPTLVVLLVLMTGERPRARRSPSTRRGRRWRRWPWSPASTAWEGASTPSTEPAAKPQGSTGP